MTSIIMILMYLKYHVFNFLLESKNQNFNSSNKPVKPIKNYLERFILIIFYKIFFGFVMAIAHFVYTVQLLSYH